jgi:hypothetical protein
VVEELLRRVVLLLGVEERHHLRQGSRVALHLLLEVLHLLLVVLHLLLVALHLLAVPHHLLVVLYLPLRALLLQGDWATSFLFREVRNLRYQVAKAETNVWGQKALRIHCSLHWTRTVRNQCFWTPLDPESVEREQQ